MPEESKESEESEEYGKHLASLHAAWATPLTVVAKLVAEVVDTAVVDIRRVVHGEANEVYDVTLEDASPVIVRISHGGGEALEREAWLLGEVGAWLTELHSKWDFDEGERFPVEWIQDGYGDASLFEPPNDRAYRALWLVNGLCRLRWYYETGFGFGAEAARDRLLSEPGP